MKTYIKMVYCEDGLHWLEVEESVEDINSLVILEECPDHPESAVRDYKIMSKSEA